jgi:hypothetical protein
MFFMKIKKIILRVFGEEANAKETTGNLNRGDLSRNHSNSPIPFAVFSCR